MIEPKSHNDTSTPRKISLPSGIIVASVPQKNPPSPIGLADLSDREWLKDYLAPELNNTSWVGGNNLAVRCVIGIVVQRCIY